MTDGQTDRRRDGQTEFSSLYRVCITCSAVKMQYKVMETSVNRTESLYLTLRVVVVVVVVRVEQNVI